MGKNQKDMNALSWAMRETPDQRGEKCHQHTSMSFLFLILTRSYTHIQRAMQILYVLQNILKLHSTEHRTVLNIPTRQDDFRFSRRHMWTFQKGLGDLEKQYLFLSNRLPSFTLNFELTASSPLGETIQNARLESHMLSSFIEFHSSETYCLGFILNVTEIPINFK